MRATRLSLSKGAVGCGGTFHTGGHLTDDYHSSFAHPTGERGIRSSSPFAEPNTAVYDSYMSWTYFQPMRVDIEKMAAPEKKYYQRLTRKPWDLSTMEYHDMITRKRFVQFWWLFALSMFMYFFMTKEKKFAGTSDISSDGIWVLLPKNRPELF